MSLNDKKKWNTKYGISEYTTQKEPCEWLKDNADYLSGKGSALDIAAGEGRNAIFVAKTWFFNRTILLLLKH